MTHSVSIVTVKVPAGISRVLTANQNRESISIVGIDNNDHFNRDHGNGVSDSLSFHCHGQCANQNRSRVLVASHNRDSISIV